jgi:hypothetical protein
MYLIVIEAESDLGMPGPDPNSYHYQPYRLAKTVEEAKAMMLDYMLFAADESDGAALVPKYFALYQEKDGEFGMPDYYDPCSTELNVTDAIEWLQDTGRA